MQAATRAARAVEERTLTIDWWMAFASFGVGIVVGLTGMGGGALMTPMLVFFFGVPPLAAVSSDLVAAAIMKPVGSWVHLRRGTVNLQLVFWLCVGSVPSAFLGVVLVRALRGGQDVQNIIKVALGVALLVAASALITKSYMRLLERARIRDGVVIRDSVDKPRVVVKKVPTVIIGIVGGLVVGLTSVGSGSLIIIALLLLYPGLKTGQLVGTDLVQAVPLVASAALAHILFGDFQMQITVSLLIGSIPGVYIGARWSATAPGGIIRRTLAIVLLASALKLLGVGTGWTVAILVAVTLGGVPAWMYMRTRLGFPAFAGKSSGSGAGPTASTAATTAATTSVDPHLVDPNSVGTKPVDSAH
jgi:uncharacterized membrane protein YfcA